MNTPHQPSLFTAADAPATYSVRKPAENLTISRDVLQEWKQRIFSFQQQVQTGPIAQQGSLFDCASVASPSSQNPDDIHPFSLPPQNTEFWRWKAEDHGVAALYFVIDYELPILLYVGETVKSNQRWKGEHDCKRYLLNYRQVHYQHQLSSQLGIAFWGHAPVKTRLRQQIESALIYKWRSPFNKENWEFWGTPFTGE